MQNLIIPMVNEAIEENFLVKPAWMATHPSGKFLAAASIEGLPLTSFDKIYFITHEIFEKSFRFSDSLLKNFHELGDDVTEIVLLDNVVCSNLNAVYECIRRKYVHGSILIKTPNNYFKIENLKTENYVCYFNLNSETSFDIKNKSFLELDSAGWIKNIVQKKAIGSILSVEGWGFESAEEFCNYCELLQSSPLDNQVNMNDVVAKMMMGGYKFVGLEISQYEDWGTHELWIKYKQTFKTFFVDLDGVLIENTSTHTIPFAGSGAPIIENIKALQKVYGNGTRCFVIITTARQEKLRNETMNEIKLHNIPCDQLIMNLPHSQRIIINDFAKNNPYPSCSSINIKRNSPSLGDYLS